nr:DNA adenine methylase [uncultured Neisseria sp.]
MPTNKPAPLVPWMGGKRRLAKHLLPMFPEHQCYVELFAGGAALFFLRPKRAKCEVLNDLNGQLINLYRVVQHHFDEFVRQFEWTLTSREVFARLQSTPPESMTDIQRAARFFYLQHTAFGGKTIDQHFGTATTGAGFKAADIAGRLKAAQQRLNGVYIENEPWEKCFKRYDREHTFFYADPPYWQLAGYDRAFDWAQYELLAKMMGECKGKVMLSINDHPDILELFKDFRIDRLELAYSVGRDKTQKTSGELVICNW